MRRNHVAPHGQMVRGRREILAERQHVDVMRTQVAQCRALRHRTRQGRASTPISSPTPAVPLRPREQFERAAIVGARPRARYSDGTVSMLWLNTSGGRRQRIERAATRPRKSGVSTSTPMPGTLARTAAMHGEMRGAAVAQVVAIDRRDHDVAQPERRGRIGQPRARRRRAARDGRARRRRTAAPRARPPMIMKVAVRCAKHSPMFGHIASSQTECSR